MSNTDAEKAAEDHLAIVRDRNLGEGARYKVKWSGLYDGQEIREAFLAGAAWAAPKWGKVIDLKDGETFTNEGFTVTQVGRVPDAPKEEK